MKKGTAKIPLTPPLNVSINGDFNRDALVPEHSVVPISTKDPALWTISSRNNIVRHIPGGAWTTDKILTGIIDAWKTFPEGKKGVEIAKVKPVKELPPQIEPIKGEPNPKRYDMDAVQDILGETYHWRLNLFPKSKPIDKNEVIRIASVVPMDNHVIETDRNVSALPKPSGSIENSLEIIADYDVGFRYKNRVSSDTLELHNSKAHPYPARILMLGSVLPRKGNKLLKVLANPPDPTSSFVKTAVKEDDIFWTSLLYNNDTDGNVSDKCKTHDHGKIGTVIVVGIDQLRLKGADLAYDQSWDRILTDFNREKFQSETLVYLSQFEHLIVRIGVTGAIHHHRETIRTGSNKIEFSGKERTTLIYDPRAPRIWFRAPDDQGNILATRSAMIGCITARLARAKLGFEPELSNYANPSQQSTEKQNDLVSPDDIRRVIQQGIKDSICFVQELYREGFGTDPEKVADFTESNFYQRVYERTVLYADCENINELRKSSDKSPKSLSTLALQRIGELPFGVKRGIAAQPKKPIFKNPQPQRKLYIAHVEAPVDESPNRWGILRNSLRMGIPDSHPLLDSGNWDRDSNYYMDQRHLWLAMKIAINGHPEVLNSPFLHAEFSQRMRELRELIQNDVLRGSGSKKLTSDLLAGRDADEIRTRKSRLSKLLEQSDWQWPLWIIENFERDQAISLLQFLGIIYPYNIPVAEFGYLTAIGQREVETYTNIRNLISHHLREGKTSGSTLKPLGIAVFGGPGSGKSFGVSEIADELGISKPLIFNVSQFNDRKDLDNSFLRICDALARRKKGSPPPLVFFDEFDCSGPGEGNDFAWLPYFLEPLQDGTYQHPSGALSLADTIFVFAGGINSSFSEFEHKAVSQIRDEDIHKAKVRKLPDFVSRLRGYIDVGSLNRKEPNDVFGPFERDIPYISRALTLRGMLVKNGFVDRHGVAQVDYNVIEAFLTVSKFKHGKRSIDSILKGAVRFKQEVTPASFASDAQLDMHTWGFEFRERMRSPGGHWLTNYLYIPSRVLPPLVGGSFPEWKSVNQWELLSVCDNFPDAKETVRDCINSLLAKIFNTESEVWLRETNIVSAADKLLSHLMSAPGSSDPYFNFRDRGWYQPHNVLNGEIVGHAMEVFSQIPVSEYWSGPSSLNARPVLHPGGDSATKGAEALPDISQNQIQGRCIPLVMIEEVQPIELRLVWEPQGTDQPGRVTLISDSTRLGHSVETDSSGFPRPKALWNRDWSWRKADKVRILRHLLRNFYIAVHGESNWEDFSNIQRLKSEASKISPNSAPKVSRRNRRSKSKR
jgi:hypothetical protein